MENELLTTYIDHRDKKEYKTVRINNQIWMAENLSYMPRIYSGISNGGIWVYNYYGRKKGLFNRTYININEAKKLQEFQLYGCLYSWEVAVQICPPGWHLPSDEEWIELEVHIGMSKMEALKPQRRGTDEGLKLKSSSGWSYNRNGSNESGFNVLPSGYRGIKGGFYDIGNSASFWTSTEESPYIAWERGIIWDKYNKDKNYKGGDIMRACSMKNMGFSIRCIKD
ncbi:MAG: FISUMP domain-containing protein [Bacteroidota bacterium]